MRVEESSRKSNEGTQKSKSAGLKRIRAALGFFLLVAVELFGQSLAEVGFPC